MQKFISVSLNQRKAIDLQILKKNVDFDSFKSSEYAATDTPARILILQFQDSRETTTHILH